MNVLGVHLSPELLEESRHELERQRQRERQIREARAALRAGRPSRFAILTARLRRPVRPDTGSPVLEGC
jgi:hypothetical protein